ncbi:MAG TPA: H-NS histone family protein [Burkholderiaceae bacterium]|nr:H-NS histone family protein [Burkholderiaceae bacterium]
MTKTNYAMQRRKLEKEIQKLQKQAAALEQKQRAPIISEIVRSMREYDITLEELETALTRRKRTAGKRAAKGVKTATPRGPVPPKYRDPDSGATWTGRGRAPRWVVEAEAQGKSREDFLIKD